MELKEFIIILGCLPLYSCFIREWTHTYGFDEPKYWNPEKVPCGKDRVFFSQRIEFNVYIENTQISAKEIILPETGSLVLTSGSGFVFGENTKSTEISCSGEDVHLKKILVYSWLGVDSWKISDFDADEIKSGEGGIAIPHRDRMPCYNDVAVFPSNLSFVMSIPISSLEFAKLRFKDSEGESHEESIFRWLKLHSDHVIRKKPISFRLVHDKGDNEICQEYITESDVCDSLVCPLPSCISPIKPKMDCCQICGGLITVEVEKNFGIRSFRKAIARWIVEEKLHNDISPIQWWVGPIGQNSEMDDKYHLQIVILDREQYDGISAAFVEDFKIFINKFYASEVKITEFLKSGLPWQRDAGVGGLWLALITLLVVIVVFVGLSIYYYGPASANVETRSFDFARFENRSREGSLAFGISQFSLNKSFENPLFSLTKKSKEEYEVTEVSLDKSDDEDDDEIAEKSETTFKE